VNNAGYGVMGAFEEQTPEQFAGQMDVNFWGTVNVCRASLPIFRKQRPSVGTSQTTPKNASVAPQFAITPQDQYCWVLS
jgi:NAD(P)-dependent dehydrogenase (short-subunit alcohol dehydrogenase family)